MTRIEHVEQELQTLRYQIHSHSLYATLSSIEDIKLFMENHVFAVWDFMSLLKALQQQLTNTNVPWIPKSNATAARFINEIVMGEESDLNELGEAKSHFEMYLDAMEQIQANTGQINTFTKLIENKKSVEVAMELAELNKPLCDFINFTFKTISSAKPHCIAAAFTFGREDVIPDMFLQIIEQSKTGVNDNQYSKLLYYLNRHIELDGDEHGPMSLQMIDNLCGNDSQKWEEVLNTAKAALLHRIALWDSIENVIKIQQKSSKMIDTIA